MFFNVLRKSSIALAFAACAACGAAPVDGTPVGASGDAPVARTSEGLTGATSCSAMIDSHINWVRAPQCGYGGYVGYQIVTHQSSGLVSMASGYVDRVSQGFTWVNPVTHRVVTVPSTLYSSNPSDGLQRFSDRIAQATIPGERSTRSFPFDPRAEDQIKLTLRDDGTAIVTLVSWGGGEVIITPTECMNDLMYGFGNGVLYSIQLVDDCTPE